MQIPAEYTPLTFQPVGQYAIPEAILSAIQAAEQDQQHICSEMSKRHPLVYFGIGRKLYAWDYQQS